MDGVTVILRSAANGVLDSFRGLLILVTLDSKIEEKAASERLRHSSSRSNRKNEPQIRDGKVVKRLIQCCSLNGGVFLFSLILFENVILPCLEYLLAVLFGESLSEFLWSWIFPILSWTFGTLWVMPLFLLSKIVNSLWFQDIADSAFWCTQGKSHYFSSISKLIADSLFSLVIQSLFLVQGMAVRLFPIANVAWLFSVIHMCMLYSLYAFEYKWCKLGWELHQRLTFMENNWPYFIGFGLPLAFITSLCTSYIKSACLFSILFPLFIISANEARPVSGACPYHLQLFSLVIALSNYIFNKTVNRTSIVSPKRRSPK